MKAILVHINQKQNCYVEQTSILRRDFHCCVILLVSTFPQIAHIFGWFHSALLKIHHFKDPRFLRFPVLKIPHSPFPILIFSFPVPYLLFHYEQIVWENSDIKWMKVSSFSLTVTKYLTSKLSRYFLWTIKITCRRFLSRLSTNVMTLLLIQIHSQINIFLSTKVIWEREKKGFISYLSAWGSDRRVCLKILPSRKNEIYLWKMATKFGMYSAINESVTVARG